MCVYVFDMERTWDYVRVINVGSQKVCVFVFDYVCCVCLCVLERNKDWCVFVGDM